MYTLSEWLHLSDQEVARIVVRRVSTAVVYLNGTRRWFLSRHKNWAEYSKEAGQAQRKLSQLFYDHGIQTLIQPLLGYDLLGRGDDYIGMAVGQGLRELTTPNYLAWFHQQEIRVTFFGNWIEVLSKRGFSDVMAALQQIIRGTAHYTKHKLLFGLFADEGLDKITALAKTVNTGEALLHQYYGQLVQPVDLIIGSGQPATWDLPLLDINKASLYFLQAPTFCLNQHTLRHILYDHLYQRVNDDDLYEDLSPQVWQDFKVLGIGQQTNKGWIAL
jgi:hypothetical protein